MGKFPYTPTGAILAFMLSAVLSAAVVAGAVWIVKAVWYG